MRGDKALAAWTIVRKADKNLQDPCDQALMLVPRQPAVCIGVHGERHMSGIRSLRGA